jgi:predicted DCC family thiol-disulfide oxidoreductase YuxK
MSFLSTMKRVSGCHWGLILSMLVWRLPLMLVEVSCGVGAQVANNRYSFMGKRAVCRLSDAGYEDRFMYT